MFSLWNNVRGTKGYVDKTYIRPTKTKDLDIDIQRENQFQKLFFKTTLSHISRDCLKSFNDNIDVAILLNMVLHFKE